MSALMYTFNSGRLSCCNWSERADSNRRPQRPERCALTKLRYSPTTCSIVTALRYEDKVPVPAAEHCESNVGFVL